LRKNHVATFAAGCFWGVEEAFASTPGVLSTKVGYTGGSDQSRNPTYEQVCTGKTGHAEAVQVAFDQELTSYEKLLDVFWENHDPTTLNRQGPDVGSQYRSAIFYHDETQKAQALASREELQRKVGPDKKVVTEITSAGEFYPAEEYHQRYFEKRKKGLLNF
jgi:peptide-methionine (S)-S-oxide reductase